MTYKYTVPNLDTCVSCTARVPQMSVFYMGNTRGDVRGVRCQFVNFLPPVLEKSPYEPYM